MVVGYVVSYLSGKGRKLADRAVDQLLERLYSEVAANLPGDPAVHRLEQDPGDDRAQAQLVDSLARATESNEVLAAVLEGLVERLGDHGAAELLIDAPVHGQVFQQVSASHGSVVGSIAGDVTIYHGSSADRRWQHAPTSVKVLAGIGMLLAVVGMGIFFVTLFTHDPDFGDPDFGRIPPGVPVAFGVFFTGFVLAGIASAIAGTRRQD